MIYVFAVAAIFFSVGIVAGFFVAGEHFQIGYDEGYADGLDDANRWDHDHRGEE